MKTKIKHFLGAVLLLLVVFGQTVVTVASPPRDPAPPPPPSGMPLVPAGSFIMGDPFGEGTTSGSPLHSVYVSAFYMDEFEVPKVVWDLVYNWAIAHGYTFDYAGSAKAVDHPVHTVNWYDAVKWCNARSEREGRTPAFYVDAKFKTRYRSGRVEPYVKWNAGYRLPTEAEWEKAARAGTSGHRFSWNDTDEITHSRANYNSTTNVLGYNTNYDTSPTTGFHPDYNDGVFPYTSPVGSFAPNGYGLYDMTGNVNEWCWDWAGPYPLSPVVDPHGPETGTSRLLRGGSWLDDSWWCRSAQRTICNGGGKQGNPITGFRSVLPAVQ
jgi:formylglycine-generating enzyme required for sulfatase activity